MSRYSKQDMQIAIRRADVAREKYLLMLQKRRKWQNVSSRESRIASHALAARLIRDQSDMVLVATDWLSFSSPGKCNQRPHLVATAFYF